VPATNAARRGASVAALAVLLSGCGGSRHASPSPARLADSAGARIFESACAVCHTLTGHDTRSDGGDLGLLHGTVAEVEGFVRIMPVHPRLTPTNVAIVATYIVGVERELVRHRR